MNPGLLLIPFLILLVVLVRGQKPFLLTLWAFSFFALPTVRNQVGSVSIYWCDLIAIAVLVAFATRHPVQGGIGLRRWGVLLLATFSFGLVSSVFRYGSVVEPAFVILRYAFALVPLLAIPRIYSDRRLMRGLYQGVIAAALFVALIGVIQSTSRPLALQLEDFFYGSFASDVSYRGGLIDESDQLRAHGVYGSATTFAGGAALIGFCSLILGLLVQRRLWSRIAFGVCILTVFLTYSRHGLLALVIFAIVFAVTSPRQSARRLGMILTISLLLSTVAASGFWTERLSRGNITEDVNLESRLIEGPANLVERIIDDPLVAFVGIGLGVEHALTSPDLTEATRGFVSNSFLLQLLYAGIAAFVTYVLFFVAALRRALHLTTRMRSLALGSILGVCVILASDNYGFFHTTFAFGWSLLVAIVSVSQYHPRWGRLADVPADGNWDGPKDGPSLGIRTGADPR